MEQLETLSFSPRMVNKILSFWHSPLQSITADTAKWAADNQLR